MTNKGEDADNDQNDAEKEVVSLIRDAQLLKKSLSLELIRDEVKSLQERKRDVAPTQLVDRLNRLKEAARVNNHKADITSAAQKLNPLVDETLRFYDWAERREKNLIANTLKAMQEEKEFKTVEREPDEKRNRERTTAEPKTAPLPRSTPRQPGGQPGGRPAAPSAAKRPSGS